MQRVAYLCRTITRPPIIVRLADIPQLGDGRIPISVDIWIDERLWKGDGSTEHIELPSTHAAFVRIYYVPRYRNAVLIDGSPEYTNSRVCIAMLF